MYPFAGFDNTCDASAVLNILEKASVFSTPIQTSAKNVRTEVRNEWGHCNFDHWTDMKFQNSFQLMETMVRSLGLPKPDEKKELDELHDWEKKGEYLLYCNMVSSWIHSVSLDCICVVERKGGSP